MKKRKFNNVLFALWFVFTIGLVLSVMADALSKEIPVNVQGEFNEEMANSVIPVIQKATKDDVLVIKINSPGGQMIVLDDILEAIHTSKAKSVCIVSGLAASAAAMLLVNCDETAVTNGAVILFHLPYYKTPYGPLRDPIVSEMALIQLNNKLNFERLIGHEKYVAFLLGYDIVISGAEFNNSVWLARLI